MLLLALSAGTSTKLYLLLYVPQKIFSLKWGHNHHRRRAAEFRPMLSGIFIVSHLLQHRTSVYQVSSEGPPHSFASYDT
jgi:hypothetical protein